MGWNSLLWLGRLGLAIAAKREIENRERQLRIILGQPLRLLTKQTKLQTLDLLLQDQRELLVLVALMLELGAMLVMLTMLLVEPCVEARLECSQSLFERRLAHDDYACKIRRSLSSKACLRLRFS